MNLSTVEGGPVTEPGATGKETTMIKVRTMGIAALASLALFSTACGGDEGGSSSDREEIVEQFVAAAEADGGAVDEACVREVVDKFPEADVEKIIEAGPDGNPEVSAEAEDLVFEFVNCVEDFGDLSSVDPSDVEIPEGVEITDAMVDAMVDQMEASGLTVDRDCIGEALEGMDLAAVASGAMTPELMQSFSGCIQP